jgi:DeoR/GlpR family transcriptional regulator of sugar metabolism
MEISQHVVVFGDGSGIGTVALGQIAPISGFQILLMNVSAPEQEIAAIRAQGVAVLIPK